VLKVLSNHNRSISAKSFVDDAFDDGTLLRRPRPCLAQEWRWPAAFAFGI